MKRKPDTSSVLTFIFLLCLLSACTPAEGASPSGSGVTPTISTTLSEYQAENCSWNWTTQPLPALSASIQDEFHNAGIENASVIAEAYGESCITETTNENLRFVAQQTDIRVSVNVDSVAYRNALGNILKSILSVLNMVPEDSKPGSSPGYIGVTFFDNETSLHLWFPEGEGKKAMEMGLEGNALLEFLENK